MLTSTTASTVRKDTKKRGWFASHIAKKHDVSHLPEKDMTVLRDNDLSQQEAALNLSDSTSWPNVSLVSSLAPTSTPLVAPHVPLCPKASSYGKEMGKSLPASFLTSLLPAPGFLDGLDKSLQEESDSNDLTFLGNSKLRNHMENTHRTDFQPSSPKPAFSSLGDYLSSLENKIVHCTNLIYNQSALLGKLLNLQEGKSQSSISTASTAREKLPIVIEIEEDQFKCKYCPFETDHKSQLNLHISGKHSKEHTIVNCPLCHYKSTSEPEVTTHVQNQHPDTATCKECSKQFTSEDALKSHINSKHRKEQSLVECPLCSYKNASEPEVTKHVENQHPDTNICKKCDKRFYSEVALKRHMTTEHFQCEECTQDLATKNDLNKHMAEQHVKEVTGWSLLIGDSHVKSIKSRQIEKVLKGNLLRNPVASSPREGSAYTTTREWPGARFPDSNLAERVPSLLNERSYKSLIALTPSNNITNIENFDHNEQNELAVKTAHDTVYQGLSKHQKISSTPVRKVIFFLCGDFTPFMSKNVQIGEHFFPILFPKDSENSKSLDIGLREVGAKRC